MTYLHIHWLICIFALLFPPSTVRPNQEGHVSIWEAYEEYESNYVCYMNRTEFFEYSTTNLHICPTFSPFYSPTKSRRPWLRHTGLNLRSLWRVLCIRTWCGFMGFSPERKRNRELYSQDSKKENFCKYFKTGLYFFL